jgi:tRNA threonylcarbamoyladenosine biosynthesis protein TsaB
MICLGIDTSGVIARVAVMGDQGAPASLSTDSGKNHSETLLTSVCEVLERAGTTLASVGLIAVGLGPGTWTGLRVGITTAKALAYALAVPVIGISTLDAIAAGATDYDGKLVVIVDARRSEVYGRRYDVDGRGGITVDGDFFVAPPESLDRFVGADYALVGNGTALLGEEDRRKRHILSARFDDVDAGVICRLARERFLHVGPDNPHDVMPIYVRKSDAEVAREKKEGGNEITC